MDIGFSVTAMSMATERRLGLTPGAQTKTFRHLDGQTQSRGRVDVQMTEYTNTNSRFTCSIDCLAMCSSALTPSEQSTQLYGLLIKKSMTSKSRNRTSVATKTKTSEHINTRSTYGLRKSFDWDGLTAVHWNGVRRTSLVDSVLHRFHANEFIPTPRLRY